MNHAMLQALRSATSTLHRSVEALAVERGVLECREGFLAHLEILVVHHRTLLEWVSAHPSPRARIAARLEELRHDLSWIGGLEDRTSRSSLRITFPGPATLWHGMGACYVVEGSRLGSIAIGRSAATYGIDVRALKGFRVSTDEVRHRWRQFIAELDAVPTHVESELIEGAVWTFESLGRAYQAWAPSA